MEQRCLINDWSNCYCFPGTQKGLQCLKVTRDGQVIEPGDVVAEECYVSTRHKELLIIKAKQAQLSKDGTVQRLGERILLDGPGKAYFILYE